MNENRKLAAILAAAVVGFSLQVPTRIARWLG
jgi:hypothetical protein